MRGFLAATLGLILGSTQVVALAQGLLIVADHSSPLPRLEPYHYYLHRQRPVSTYKIKELGVHARIVDQVARVQVSQSFVNTGHVPMEAQFLFPLPHDGAIDQLTLLVDGKEFPGKLMPASDARSIYESIVRTNKDPALLEWMGTGLFQTNVFPVPPGAERKITLHYNQVLRKNHGLTEFLFPLSTAKYTSHAPEKIDVKVTIESGIDIKNVYSPNQTVEIKRPDGKHATVNYSRTNEIPTADFRILFDVDKGQVGASVISYRPSANDDGYFLLLASPQVKPVEAMRPKKTVIFVVDRSGSMAGKKFEQARAALKFVLDNLREDDLFNIVAYESTVESFRPELERYTAETRKAAIGFVEGLNPGGGTNIHQSLTTALGQLKDDSRPNYVLFLTDGLPTVGVKNESQICQAAKESNKVRARILTFGVGYDVNSRLLDRLARDGFGSSEYVRPDEDIEAHVSAVYANISAPVLTGVAINVQVEGLRVEEGPPVNRIYPKENFDLFEGQQLVVVGRYKKAGPVNFVIQGRIDGQQQKFDFPAVLVDESSDESYAFVEKLWAMRRIGEIIDQIDLVGKNEELVKELVELSTRHGILTPYTSFLADDSVRPILSSVDGIRRAHVSLYALSEANGESGFRQRASKGKLQKAANSDMPKAGGAETGLRRPRMRHSGSIPLSGQESDESLANDNVRQYGNQAFYARSQTGKKERILVTPETADLDPDKDSDKIEIIDRFTEPYFALIQANSATENQILSQQPADEHLLIKLRGKNVLIR